MARHKNILDDSELAVIEKKSKSYVDSFSEAIDLFVKDCEIATFTKDQLKKLFKQPDLKTFTGVLDYSIMLLMLETGIRVNELAGLSLDDIRWEDNMIIIRNAKSYRERLVPIQKEMKQQLKKYIAIRGYVESEALFVTVDGTRLTKRGIQQRI